jgi:uncharacterized protein
VTSRQDRASLARTLRRCRMAQFDSDRGGAEVILAEGDRVIVQACSLATTKRGDPHHQTYCFIFRARHGRLTELVEHCDTALAERVLDPVQRSRFESPR